MTKHRPALTLGAALGRIRGQLPGGWHEMAAIADRSVSTVYAWDAPDGTESIPMDCAIKLDIAFQQAGGVGAPIYEVYAIRMKAAEAAAFAEQVTLTEHLAVVMKEGAEAEQAILLSTLPADAADRAIAKRHARQQVEESIAAQTAALALLREEPPRPP